MIRRDLEGGGEKESKDGKEDVLEIWYDFLWMYRVLLQKMPSAYYGHQISVSLRHFINNFERRLTT